MNFDYLPKTEDVKRMLVEKYKNKDFVIDKTGVKLVEVIGISFIADKDYIIREPNYDYAKREIAWYESQSLNVYDIPGKVPKIWQEVADKDGFINSNYGYLIFSKENYEQFKNAVRELKRNPFSRRAIMIYNRPSMHYEYNKNGMSDFICTMYNQLFIRDNELISYYSMRSQDVVFGYNNDNIWAKYVLEKAYRELKQTYPDLKLGEVIWNCGSLHVYERHFKYLEEEV